MQPISTSSRNRAIVAAVAFTVGALTVMLQDIIDLRAPLTMWENWTMKHTLAVLTILGVTLIAEEGWSAHRAGRPVVAVGIALVVAAGLVLIVYNSVGRQVEAVSTTQLVAQDHNDKIADAKTRLEAAKVDLKAANAEAIQTSAEKNCKSNCRAVILETQKAAQIEVEAARTALVELGAPVAVAPKLEQWAEIMSIFGVDPDLTKKVAERFEYPLLTLLFEIGAMVSWCFARRAETVLEQPTPAAAEKPSPADTAQTSFPAATVEPPETDPPPGNRRRRQRSNRRKTVAGKPSATVLAFPAGGTVATVSNRRPSEVSELAARAWLLAYVARHGGLPSQDTMATELSVKDRQVHKGTVAKWLKKWEAEGLIVREQSGRCKTVRMA